MQSRETQKLDFYPSPLDAIVLAGTDANPKRLIQGRRIAGDIGYRVGCHDDGEEANLIAALTNV